MLIIYYVSLEYLSLINCLNVINQINQYSMKKNVMNSGIIRRNVMRLLSLTIVLAFLMPMMSNAQGGKANFAGTWAFNASKSDMGQPPANAPAQGQGGGQRGGFGGGNMVAKQEANLLTVETTRTGQDGTPQTSTMKYTLDGKESVNTSTRGESKSVATWSADGKSLTIVTTRTFNDREMKTTEVWSLTDAKTLSITSTRAGQNGDVTTKRVYDMK
jgi:hypothetical protein